MLHYIETEKKNLIAVKLIGKISKNDVQTMHNRIDTILETSEKVDFYFEMENFDGYELEGLWADIKVDIKHLTDYGKMALVGEKNWQELVAKGANLFTKSEIKYFELFEKEKAQKWIGL